MSKISHSFYSMPIVIRNNNESPFDSLRRLDENGNEYWYGREVMPLLGYSNWQPFGGQREDRLCVIEKSLLACRDGGYNPENHFTPIDRPVIRSNKGLHLLKDWELSRFACNLVVHNCSSEKLKVLEAQSYFVVNTPDKYVEKTRKVDLSCYYKVIDDVTVKITTTKESVIRDELVKELGGITEVECETGRIDILTKNEVVEVKKVSDWKSAVGQVLVYQQEYPDHSPRIHLYGECSCDFKKMIVKYVSKFGIKVTFDAKSLLLS
jgi:hypothetical protein